MNHDLRAYGGAAAWGLAVFYVLMHALVIFFDLWAASQEPPAPSITDQLRQWSARYPLLPLGCGLVVGHLFW